MNETKWLRSHVERCLQDSWELYPVPVDGDGDYPFRWGTAACYVSLSDEDADYLRIWACAAEVPKRSLKLLSELNDINERARTCRVYWCGGWVIAEQSVPTDALTGDVVGNACMAVGSLADDIGVLLAAMFAGETPFPAAVEEQPSR